MCHYVGMIMTEQRSDGSRSGSQVFEQLEAVQYPFFRIGLRRLSVAAVHLIKPKRSQVLYWARSG